MVEKQASMKLLGANDGLRPTKIKNNYQAKSIDALGLLVESTFICLLD